MMIWDGGWLSASCLLLPDLRTFAAKALGTKRLLASIPNRDVLLVFPEADAASRAKVQKLIRKNEAGARKPLTWELFRLGPKGPEPFADR